ncbi:PREDICTED: transmembrane protein C5orf28 homolog [Nicrophorus vespilloides]|uniref:Transmembrane protein 267 n=1 Tax=Nicrophorus vespilloides TaxID=110193 RepID=A0ABM1N035_NICVS|nr:PREDICTED: transmembrane protein C5orf28 homolog [Nicrophorus vespilloides]
MFINLPWSQWYLMLFIVFTAVAGDYLVSRSRLQMIKAFFDNITHAIIGALSWYTVCSQYKNRSSTSTLCEVLMCTFASSVVDIDHFLAAGSLSLSAATNLENRPIFHCSTIPIVSTIVGLCISKYFNLPVFEKAVFIFFTALATHHTRDANRRGYWVPPFGSTKPLPYTLYIIITLAIPYFVSGLMKFSNVQKQYKYTTIIV